jgi:hypothetical protein
LALDQQHGAGNTPRLHLDPHGRIEAHQPLAGKTRDIGKRPKIPAGHRTTTKGRTLPFA